MGQMVEAEVWKVVDGEEVELKHNGNIFRRVGHLLIENKPQSTTVEPLPLAALPQRKIPSGKRVKDVYADNIYEKTGHGIMTGILDGLTDYLLTGFRTKKQITRWMSGAMGRHTEKYLEDRADDYIHYLDSRAKLDTQLINGKNAYRYRVK